ncbi:MAG: hypothetical protein Q9181_005442 [Wetmoreana brouardii]
MTASQAIRSNTIVMLNNDTTPLEASNLTELAAEAIRHGMTWTVFRPEHGVFLAEGNGHVLRRVPQASLIFEYIPDPCSRPKIPDSLYVRGTAVDKLFFGILQGQRSLNLKEYRIGTTADVYNTMHLFDPTGTATKKIRDNRHPSFAPKCLFGFSDIIPLALPTLRETLCNSTVIRLPVPAEYTTGLLTHKEGFVLFSHRLDEFIRSSQYTESPRLPVPPMVLQVQHMYRCIQQDYPEWEDEVLANSQINNRSPDFLYACESAWRGCTDYFHGLISENGEYFYRDLMAAHLKNAVNWWHQAWNRMREGTARDNYGLRDYIAEGMHLYWDYLELVVEEMRERGWMDVRGETIREAWVVMIFRGFCWWRSHWMMEGQEMCEAPSRLPSQYYAEGIWTKNGDGEDDFVVVEKGKASPGL